MENKRDIITVDGVAASGKSAIAHGLAKILGYGHLNSGLLYRAVAFLCLVEKKTLDDSKSVIEGISHHSISLAQDEGTTSVVCIDGVVCREELLSAEVSKGASLVARHQEVRDRLKDLQRNAFQPGGIVAEGRDMGTVIFPDARIKFFVTAPLEVRAYRRFVQLQGAPQETTLEQIQQDLEERDKRDASSPVGTMRQAEGAILVDNSGEPLDVVIQRMADMAKNNGTYR